MTAAGAATSGFALRSAFAILPFCLGPSWHLRSRDLAVTALRGGHLIAANKAVSTNHHQPECGCERVCEPLTLYRLVTPCRSREPRQATGENRDLTPAANLQNIHAQGGHALVRDLKFTHLTTNDGLSQGYVTAILQDRRGFMWFATRDGLNRYDGNTFVVYKHNPNDPGSLSSNFIQDLVEDDHGYLWISTNTGVNKFDPITERFTRYLHDPNNPNSIGGAYVTSIARDSRGYSLVWHPRQRPRQV